MDKNELICTLTLKAIDEMKLSRSVPRFKSGEFEKYVVDTVIDTYLKIAQAVMNNQKAE